MAYFKECPYCGAALDPGERCDCMKGESDGEESRKVQLCDQT